MAIVRLRGRSEVFPDVNSPCSGKITRQMLSDSFGSFVLAERVMETGVVLVSRCMVPDDLFLIIVSAIALSSGAISPENGVFTIFSTGFCTIFSRRLFAYRIIPFRSSIAIPSAIPSRHCRKASSIFSSGLVRIVHPSYQFFLEFILGYSVINISRGVDKHLGKFARDTYFFFFESRWQ